MSYILDALKKSELARNGEELPESEWNQEEDVAPPTPEPDKSSRLTLGVLVALIPVLLGLVYWVFFNPNKELSESIALIEPEIAQKNIANVGVASPSPDVNTVAKVATSPAAEKINKMSFKDFNKASGVEKKQVSSNDVVNTKKRATVIFSDQPLDVEEPVKRRKISKADMSKLVNMDDVAVSVFELPEDIQRALPELLFSGHVYSSDIKKRHIMINASKLKEGDVAAAGILLDKITITGAEFIFKKRRFSLNALQDWEGVR